MDVHQTGEEMEPMEIIWPFVVPSPTEVSKPQNLRRGQSFVLCLWMTGKRMVGGGGGWGGVCVTLVDKSKLSSGFPRQRRHNDVNVWGIRRSRDILFVVGKPGSGGRPGPG